MKRYISYQSYIANRSLKSLEMAQVEAELNKALAATSRRIILKAISTHPKSIEELSSEIDLAPMTVRHHLEVLMKVGLAEEDSTRVTHGVGRPLVRYKATNKPISITFPKRNYLFLSDFLIRGLIERLGEEKTRDLFLELGRRSGTEMVREAAQKGGVANWTPEAVVQHLINNIFEEFGVEPELVGVSGSEVNFLEHNCLFRELAVKYPQVVCDGLDDGLHQGIDSALGPKARTRKLKCIGHGDAVCQYAISLPKE